MSETLPTSPQEALTALEAGLPVICADGSRLWKTVDGQYHYGPQIILSNVAHLVSAFASIGRRIAPIDHTLTSDDLFTLLIVIVLRDATVAPVESGEEESIETALDEPGERTAEEVHSMSFFRFLDKLEHRTCELEEEEDG